MTFLIRTSLVAPPLILNFFCHRRDPETLVRPLGFDASDEEKEQRSERVLQHTARAKRIIILVRHGQYNDKVNNEQPFFSIRAY